MNRREFAKGGMAAAALTAFVGCGDAKAERTEGDCPHLNFSKDPDGLPLELCQA